MQRRDDSFRTWFVFSRSEKRGIIFLIVMTLLLMGVRFIQKHRAQNLVVKYELQVPDPDMILPDSMDSGSFRTKTLPRSQPAASYASFDPNSANKKILLAFGFSPEIASRIVKYRDKGGVFYKPTDLYKIYGIDSHLVSILMDQGIIKVNTRVSYLDTGHSLRDIPKYSKAIEINSADTLSFILLPGIGQVLSRRIIRYREILGGFYRVEQLKEVYGIDDSLYFKISENLTVDTLLIRHLFLNRSPIEAFRSHPYINDYEAKAIIQYRRLMGSYSNCEELVNHYILSENTYRKVRGYLRLN